MVKYCDCEVGTCEERDAAARCVYLHYEANEKTVALRADLKAVAVAGVKLMTYLDFIKLDCSETEREFHEALARPGVVALLEGVKDG